MSGEHWGLSSIGGLLAEMMMTKMRFETKSDGSSVNRGKKRSHFGDRSYDLSYTHFSNLCSYSYVYFEIKSGNVM